MFGLLALLDDIAAIAKAAAASLDDVAAITGKASAKAAGVVVDDAAVTPGYVVGLSPERELPIIWKIAVGSLKNKLLFLLPVALLLSLVAQGLIIPLLMAGGAFLCFEGAEKVLHKLLPHGDASGAGAASATPLSAEELEGVKVKGAIRTDLILSAEIMAITLSTVAEQTPSIVMQASVLVAVGFLITVVVYGTVALIVKTDDIGLALAKTRVGFARLVGRGLVRGVPPFLGVLGVLGTAAMLWVGGGILVHGLDVLGVHALHGWIHHAEHAAAHAVPSVGGFLGWLTQATLSGIVGLVVGAAIIPAVSLVKRLLPKRTPKK